MSQITDTAVNIAGTDGDGNRVSVTDGIEVKCSGDGWGRKTCFKGTDGDGYILCGNEWEWVNFPLPCSCLYSMCHVITGDSSVYKLLAPQCDQYVESYPLVFTEFHTFILRIASHHADFEW